MEKEGTVSLWLGQINSASELKELMRVKYSEDGDFIPSKFAQYFSIVRYDDTTREAEYYDTPQESLEKLLEGFSYYKHITPKFVGFPIEYEISRYNCVILLYNFEYDQELKSTDQGNNYFEFIGSVSYKAC